MEERKTDLILCMAEASFSCAVRHWNCQVNPIQSFISDNNPPRSCESRIIGTGLVSACWPWLVQKSLNAKVDLPFDDCLFAPILFSLNQKPWSRSVWPC